jgi:hypothetical protein
MPSTTQNANDINSVNYASGDTSWSSVFASRINASDGQYTEVDLDYGDQSEWLEIEYNNFTEIVSTDQIDSVTAKIEGSQVGIQHQSSPQVRFSDDNGSSWCSGHTFTNFQGSTDVTKSITCSHHSWTYNTVDDLRVQYRTGVVDEDNQTYRIDFSQTTVVYSEIAPNVPTNLAETFNFDNNTINVSWTASTGNPVVNYTVDYNGTTTTVSGTSVTLTNLDYNTQYVIKVRANGVDNSSAYTSTVTSDYTRTAPLEDINFTYAPLRETGFCLKWENISGGVSNWKLVYYDGSTTSPPTVTPASDEFDYKWTGLTKNKRHLFKLVARNGDNLYDEGGAKVIG